MRLFSGFSSSSISAGVHTGRIKARSTEEPSRDITYTVDVEFPSGVVRFENAKPQDASRWLSFNPTLRLVPFEINQAVIVHVVGRDGSYSVIIGEGEKPDHGACP